MERWVRSTSLGLALLSLIFTSGKSVDRNSVRKLHVDIIFAIKCYSWGTSEFLLFNLAIVSGKVMRKMVYIYMMSLKSGLSGFRGPGVVE